DLTSRWKDLTHFDCSQHQPCLYCDKNELPRSKLRVSEKTELLAVQLCVLLTLTFDILFNALFIAMLPYRAHEIPVTPKLASRKHKHRRFHRCLQDKSAPLVRQCAPKVRVRPCEYLR